LINDIGAFAPDQNCDDIVTTGGRYGGVPWKLTSGDMGRLISIAAAIQRKGEVSKG
jgi:hypothetical protein